MNSRITGHGVLDYIGCDFEAAHALRAIADACDGDCFVVGGAVRDSVLSFGRFGDLDIMVNNDDRRAYRALDDLAVPYTLNRRGNREYHWGHVRLDVFEPKRFYGGFSSVRDALCFFDLRINALGVQVGPQVLLDPLSGGQCLALNQVGINWDRWNAPSMSPPEIWILLIRLARIMHNAPSLKFSPSEVERLHTVLDEIEDADWQLVHERFPTGKSQLLKLILGYLETRVSNPC